MSPRIAYVHDFELPWDNKRKDRQTLKKWLTICLTVIFALGGSVPWLPLPEVEREELEELPPPAAAETPARTES